MTTFLIRHHATVAEVQVATGQQTAAASCLLAAE